MEKPRKAARSARRGTAIALFLTVLLTLADSSYTEPAPVKVLEPEQYIETPLQAENDRLGNKLEELVVFLPAPAAPVAEEVEPEDTPETFAPMAVPLPADLQLLVWNLCGEYGTPLPQRDFFELVLKVMWNESRHQLDVPDNYNKNGTTDRGLMQINSVNWEPLAADGLDVDQVEDNIEAGIRYLAGYLNDYDGDMEYALTAYGYGPTGARAKGGQSDTAKRIINLDLEEVASIEFS